MNEAVAAERIFVISSLGTYVGVSYWNEVVARKIERAGLTVGNCEVVLYAEGKTFSISEVGGLVDVVNHYSDQHVVEAVKEDKPFSYAEGLTAYLRGLVVNVYPLGALAA